MICLAPSSTGVPSDPPCTTDPLIGTGGTDGSGQFVDGANQPGIPVDPPLAAGDCPYAYDSCLDAVGEATCIPFAAPAPVLSGWLTAAGGVLLALISLMGIRRLRESE